MKSISILSISLLFVNLAISSLEPNNTVFQSKSVVKLCDLWQYNLSYFLKIYKNQNSSLILKLHQDRSIFLWLDQCDDKTPFWIVYGRSCSSRWTQLLKRWNHLLIISFLMQLPSKKDLRTARFAAIRQSLSANPAILATTNRLEEKMERRMRRNSQAINDSDYCSSRFRSDNDSDHEDNYISLFHDKYELREKAGQGAHGVVNRCIQRQTGEQCAVKTLTLDREHILHLKKNFMDIKALKHPHVLAYKALFFQPKISKCYLVTNYLPFPNLEEVQIDSEEELQVIAFQLLKTLKYIHEHKICHRDIKPQNILYDKQNRSVKVIDFDISKKVEDRGRKRNLLTITGTPYFRAPEMFEGGGYDEMVDIWALGVTIFKLMTGSTPFESEYHIDTISNIMKGDVNFPEKLRFECSQAPRNLVRRLLKKSKKERLTAEQALKDVWFMELNTNAQQEQQPDEMSRSLTSGKSFFDLEHPSPVKYNMSHSPVLKSNKKVKIGQCTKSFKLIFQKPESSIFGMEESEIKDLS